MRRPRPLGRSGRVITSAGRWRALAASRSRTAAAKSDVPRKTVLKISAARLGSGFARFPRLAHRTHGLLARLSRDSVEDQDAVEVVDLVLDYTRAQTLGLDLELVAPAVARA